MVTTWNAYKCPEHQPWPLPARHKTNVGTSVSNHIHGEVIAGLHCDDWMTPQDCTHTPSRHVWVCAAGCELCIADCGGCRRSSRQYKLVLALLLALEPHDRRFPA